MLLLWSNTSPPSIAFPPGYLWEVSQTTGWIYNLQAEPIPAICIHLLEGPTVNGCNRQILHAIPLKTSNEHEWRGANCRENVNGFIHSVMNKALVVLEVQQKPLVIKATTARWNFEGQPGEAAGSFIRLHVWRNSAGIHISSSLISFLITRPQSNISLVGKTVVWHLTQPMRLIPLPPDQLSLQETFV